MIRENRYHDKYVIGIDGGGTKTACLLTNANGSLIAYSEDGCSNHQIVGIKQVVSVITYLVDEVCMIANIDRNQLSCIYMGLAGADLESDISMLYEVFKGSFKDIDYKIENDIWNAFYAGATKNWGAVSICGTGNNLGVKDRNGKIYSVRALRYMLGNYGGGNHLSEIALHYAFRCEESTGPYTKLVDVLPLYCDCTNMDDLAKRIYESDYTYHKEYNIPRLVFDLAKEGDEVCIKIINDMGKEISEMIIGLVGKAGLSDEKIPIILAGSQYTKDEHGILVNTIINKLKLGIKNADVYTTEYEPVIGSVIAAFNELNITIEEQQKDVYKLFVNEKKGIL
jgi:N-acetylglucosamine kinase-like BadF-type ATPase